MFTKMRGWDKSSNRMGIVKNTYGLACGEPTYVDLVLKGSPKKNLNVGHVILMSYTTVNDEDGKEIYEGDILWVSGLGNCKVYFCESTLSYRLLLRSGSSAQLSAVFKGRVTPCKVLGNIYENPELFKGS